ncbi:MULTISPECIES: phosphotransferase [Actinomyces]|uniref:Phosphotransferase n=1 Tax=Actinomyces respiraculi TaxID=2744574 RepID=A0A7T0LLD8_9ACTO|nr:MULTISPECIES: phosphotransferase [Actinomyces]QPL05835.1 phosphotransferase [Actinomyces respiraculi]
MAAPLTEPQFHILNAMRAATGPLTQRDLAQATGLSLGTVNTHVRRIETTGLIADRSLTPAGLEALTPYKVDNAVIMAAGLSSRFAPISYERPKGTLRVRGEVLIERQIEQLHAAGITDVTVVVGYKKEYFFYLIEKYGVDIVVNREYASRNNNGSLWLVRDRLANTYVCSSDDYFTTNPFEPYVYQAYYSAQYIAGPTEEWCIQTGPAGRITGATVGGADTLVMLGHVYFDRAFSTRFNQVLEKVYHRPETIPLLWESIYLDHVKELDMVVRPYPEGVINEFDSLDELRAFDPGFMENLDSEVFTHIALTLGCDPNDVSDFYPLKQGITNLSCHFSVGDDEYVYRHPGAGTEKMVDRHAEFEALTLARDAGVDRTFVDGDVDKGWKISRFVPGSRNLDVTIPDELRKAMRLSRHLHDAGAEMTRSFDFVEEGLRYEALLSDHGPIEVPGYHELREKVLRLKAHADADGFPRVPSHNDFFPPNFLVAQDGHIDLIDWEYAGMSDVAADFGTMVVCTAEMDEALAEQALEYYFKRVPTAVERRHFWAYVVLAGWCWYVWALLKEAEGDDVGEWLLTYYRYAVDDIDTLLAQYENED